MINVEILEKKIKVSFNNKQLLTNALVHRSYLNENKNFPFQSNEKLEFLGDSVLSLITAIYLYKQYPSLHEGEYTDIKAAIVKTDSLYEAAKALKLGEFIFLSNGEVEHYGRDNKSILADTFEALIAAIFLDKSFDDAYDFVCNYLFTEKLDYIVKNKLYQSAKNRLQEILQDKYKKLPVYTVLSENGPEHKKNYTIGVFFEKKQIGEGTGTSKKEAEEKAAFAALQILNK